METEAAAISSGLCQVADPYMGFSVLHQFKCWCISKECIGAIWVPEDILVATLVLQDIAAIISVLRGTELGYYTAAGAEDVP